MTLTVRLPPWPGAGVPEIVAVPSPCVAKVSPVGNGPVADSVTVPTPVTETVNDDVVPTEKSAVCPAVNAGAGPTWTDSCCRAVVPAEVAVTETVVSASVVPVVVEGVPEIVAVPLPFVAKVRPVGSLPFTVSDGTG